MTVANIPALHCCQYNLTVNAIIYCNCICIVKYVYASIFAILNDKLLTIYWTWQFPNFAIFSVFYGEVFQIYCIPFVPKTTQKQFIITVTYIPLMTASECIYKCFLTLFPWAWQLHCTKALNPLAHSGVKGIVAGFVSQLGHRHGAMALARAQSGLERFGTWSGSSPGGDGSGLVLNAVIFSPGVMDALYSLSSLKTVCAWWRATTYRRWPCLVVTHRHTYLGSFFLNPEDIRGLSLGANWNCIKI